MMSLHQKVLSLYDYIHWQLRNSQSVQSDMSVWSYNNAFSASCSTLDASTSAKAIATAWQCLQKALPEVPQDQKGV